MKDIFTYPNNSSTNFIDPLYDGDDTVGFQKRIKDLKDGNYLAWTGTAPTKSVDIIQQELSKFNQHPSLENGSGNNTMYQFWLSPVFKGVGELIENTISSATAVHQTTSNVEFSGNHGLYDAQKLTLTGFNGSWSELNGDDLFVKKIDANTIQLATDSSLNNLVEFYDLENADISSATVAVPGVLTTSSHDLNDETLVTLSNFNNSYAEYNGDNFYIQNSTSTTFNLSFDQAGNNLLNFATSQDNVVIDSFKIQSDGKFILRINSSEVQNPDGSEVEFDADSSHSNTDPAGPGHYLRSGSGRLFLKSTGTAHEYEIHSPSDPDNLTFPLNDAVLWTSKINTSSSFLLQKQTDFQLIYAADKNYVARYTLTGTGSADLTGGKIAAITSQLNGRSSELNSITSENTVSGDGQPDFLESGIFFAEQVSGDVYEAYTDTGRTARQYLNYDVINAERVIQTSTDTMVHMPKKYDSAGVEITSSSFVMNNDYNIDLSIFDKINNQTLFVGPTGSANAGVALSSSNQKSKHWRTGHVTGTLATTAGNDIPASSVSQTFSRRAGTYETDAVIDMTNAADNTLTAVLDTSSNTVYHGRLETFNTNFIYQIEEYNTGGTTFNADIITQLDSIFDAAGAGGVRNTAYVCELGYYDDSASPATPAGKFVASGNTKAIFFYRTATQDTADEFHLIIMDIDANGNMSNPTIPTEFADFGYSSLPSTADKKYGFRTKLINCFDIDTATGSSTTTYSNNCGLDAIVAVATNGLRANTTSDIFTDDVYNGQLCTVKIYNGEICEDNLVATHNNLALLLSPDTTVGDTNNNANIRFMKLDSSNNMLDDTTDVSGVFQSVTLFQNYSDPHIEIIVETEQMWTRNIGHGLGIQPTNNRLFVSNSMEAVLTNGHVLALQGDTEYNNTNSNMHTLDVVNANFTAATQGTVTEVFTPATTNIIPVSTITAATAGTLTASTTASARYRLSSVDSILFGNNTYLQQTGASTFVNNAAIKETEILSAGGSGVNSNFTHFPDNLVTSTDSDGFLTGISGFDSEFPGAFGDSGDKMFTIETVANTYTAPAISTEAAEDVFDTDDEWNTTQFENGLKTFPTTVTPQSLTVRITSPNAVTQSQNGTKFARTSGFSKYSLDVTYPPMSPEQYVDYNGFISALNGQKHPFYFDIKQNNTKMFGRSGSYGVDGVRYRETASAGANTVLIEGFSSNQTDAIKLGELIIAQDGIHGNIKTAGSSTDANIYGEAKFRFTTPLHSAQTIGSQLFNDPQHIIVSLDTDTVEVSRDTAGFYYLSLSFTADQYK